MYVCMYVSLHSGRSPIFLLLGLHSLAITVIALEFCILHFATMDYPILRPNLIQQMLSRRMMVRTIHLIDNQLCKFMTRVNDLRMSCTVWYGLGFLQSSTDD